MAPERPPIKTTKEAQMKLTVPAVRPAIADPHRKEVSQHTTELLAEIDTLLALVENALRRAERAAQPAVA